jgi:hypothetical protein
MIHSSDPDVNIEGIDVVLPLLQKMDSFQMKLYHWKIRLRLY